MPVLMYQLELNKVIWTEPVYAFSDSLFLKNTVLLTPVAGPIFEPLSRSF